MIKKTRSETTKIVCRIEIYKIFDNLKFEDKTHKKILSGTYLCNIDAMIDFAKLNKKNPLDYVKEIKQILLKDPKIHER